MYKNTCKRKIYRFYFSLVGNKSTFSIVKTRGNVNCMVHSNNYFLIKKKTINSYRKNATWADLKAPIAMSRKTKI